MYINRFNMHSLPVENALCR